MEGQRSVPQTKEHAKKVIAPDGHWSINKAIEAYGSPGAAVINIDRLFKGEIYHTPEDQHKGLKKLSRSLHERWDNREMTPLVMEYFVEKMPINNKPELLKALVEVKKHLEGNDAEFVRNMTYIMGFKEPTSTIVAQFNREKKRKLLRDRKKSIEN